MRLYNLPYFFFLFSIIYFFSIDGKAAVKKNIIIDNPDIPPYLKLDNTKWVDSLLLNMTIDEKIGQFFFIPANSHSDTESEIFFKYVDSYHTSILWTNVKRWKKISDGYLFEDEDLYYFGVYHLSFFLFQDQRGYVTQCRL